ncbi:single-stranded DNA-binding protein [Pseudanabaena sp. PCC 6802]|uniref:single-stranded DNA-binding protein n=1 Tax=Pseudanabaena sp. PCC 6802 TaxID=118173 RepID=UPI00034A5399|nr:single-stranded DNA-binding protein [Pseudanabaena sp. PCC 6802]
MNSFTLLAEIVSDPELRYTPDNQNSIASFLVQFSSSREEDAPSRLKVVGWNRLADEIMEKYHKGDAVVIEGRLGMNVIDRGNYKEKRAEMTASRIHMLSGALSASTASAATASTTARSSKSTRASSASVPKATPPAADDEPGYDNIPF